MAKVKTSVIFKQYQKQQVLLPPSLDELISSKHLVRVVNQVVEPMDISDLINLLLKAEEPVPGNLSTKPSTKWKLFVTRVPFP
jgi:transposase